MNKNPNENSPVIAECWLRGFVMSVLSDERTDVHSSATQRTTAKTTLQQQPFELQTSKLSVRPSVRLAVASVGSLSALLLSWNVRKPSKHASQRAGEQPTKQANKQTARPPVRHYMRNGPAKSKLEIFTLNSTLSRTRAFMSNGLETLPVLLLLLP